MSTTSLSTEERKQKLNEYIFQRRMLLMCTATIGLGIIIWTVAISTDHWFMVISKEGNGFSYSCLSQLIFFIVWVRF